MTRTVTTTSTSNEGEPRPDFLAHQFVVPRQQYEAGSFGIILVLINEAMLFGVLFIAYSVFRVNHPEIFRYGHLYEDRWLGATDTAVMVTSSFTISLAIWAIQHNRQRLMMLFLCVSVALGLCFTGLKSYEYFDHFQKGLLWGKLYMPQKPPKNARFSSPGHVAVPAQVGRMAGDTSNSGLGSEAGVSAIPIFGAPLGGGAQGGEGVQAGGGEESRLNLYDLHHSAPARQTKWKPKHPLTPGGFLNKHSRWPIAAIGPSGIMSREQRYAGRWRGPAPSDVRLYFTFYFCLTGLHLLHLFTAMVAVAWLLYRAAKKQFSARYFYPVQCVGLYWHFVDIAWFFIFILFYVLR